MAQEFDLFGDPIPEGRGRRGRPQHLATTANRNKVSMLLALGWSNERIAGALGITPPSLRKHYFSELKTRDVARDRLNAARVMKLWDQVEAGNVGAMRELDRFLDRNDLMMFGQAGMPARPASTPPSTTAPKLGKKEAALIAAQQPDTGSRLGALMAQRQQRRPN